MINHIYFELKPIIPWDIQKCSKNKNERFQSVNVTIYPLIIYIKKGKNKEKEKEKGENTFSFCILASRPYLFLIKHSLSKNKQVDKFFFYIYNNEINLGMTKVHFYPLPNTQQFLLFIIFIIIIII
jgi:hypothetical protein